MCSKILLSVSLLLGLSACSLVHDDPKASASLQSESTSLSCLKAAPTQARKLFAGEYTASKEDMNDAQALWSCLDVSLKYFAQFARGEDPNFYTAKELQAFANRFLPKGQPFTDGFTNSIFQLKSAIVGGDPTRLTQAEVSILRSKLSQFGEMIVPLAPYINTLIKSDSTVPTDPNARITARNNLRIFAGKLAIFFSQSPNNLAWSDLNTFVVELESYVGNQNHTFASAVSTLQLVTPVLIGEKGPALTPSDLQALINKGISIYLVWANQPSPHSTSDTLIAIGHSLDTLLSAPTFASLTETEIMSAYQNVQDFVTKVNPNPAKPIQWAKIRNYIAQGLAAKKILFQTPDNSLSSFDLTKLSILYQSFTSGSTLANDFESLQLALKTQGFLNAKIADLIPLVNAILPPDQSLESR